MKRSKNILCGAGAIVLLSMGMGGNTAVAGGLLDIEFGDVPFAAPLVIDNPYWPLNPDGATRTFTYIGETEDECVVDQVRVNDASYGATYDLSTDDGTSPYYGLTALQVVDIEWVFEDVEEGNCNASLLMSPGADDAIKELTLDWYVQDIQQNIWYVGEYSQSFEDILEDGVEILCSEFDFQDGDVPEECTEGSWEAGIAGGEGDEAVVGEAGIVVPGDFPLPGEALQNGTYFMQEVAFEAEDMAKILRQGAALSVEDGVAPGDYENCRKTKEWTALEPGASVEHKWYCADGPGLVLIEGVGGGPTEFEILVDVNPPIPR